MLITRRTDRQRQLIVNVERERLLCFLTKHDFDLRFLIFDF